MHIETELNIGDTIYKVVSGATSETVSCAFCGGTGKVITLDVNGYKHNTACPECHGQGKHVKYRYKVEKRHIKNIRINIDEDESYTEYRDEWDLEVDLSTSHTDFKTYAEAKAQAARMNAAEE